MKKKSLLIALSFVFCLLSVHPPDCCVGRLLVIAVNGSADQVIMGEMLSVLINERTGTAVNIVQHDTNAYHETVLEGKADIYISYVGVAQSGMEVPNNVDDPLEAYALVSRSYIERFGMVWLRPFGFRGPLTMDTDFKKEGRTLAAPVTTKEVLKKFPVLDRVINKLGSRIDDKTIGELMKNRENQDVKEVVKEFLKTQGLI